MLVKSLGMQLERDFIEDTGEVGPITWWRVGQAGRCFCSVAGGAGP